MVEYPYILVTGRLKDFLKHIKSAGVPPKITISYLPSVSFKSTNDRPIVKVLKFIGFLDSSGIPTESYKQFRLRGAEVVMAKALRVAYEDLFRTYPDAYRKDNEALKDFFRSHTTAGEQVVNQTVVTFKALCEFADFEAKIEGEKQPKTENESEDSSKGESHGAPRDVTVNINIQLQLPATDDAQVYENLFSALKKHLYP
ncbi:MAG: DUF5343 domain-containing protein [Methanomicrobia archaeon]|nr:DUF5343 domain-containing protein [Methanomicrobia archaeon]